MRAGRCSLMPGRACPPLSTLPCLGQALRWRCLRCADRPRRPRSPRSPPWRAPSLPLRAGSLRRHPPAAACSLRAPPLVCMYVCMHVCGLPSSDAARLSTPPRRASVRPGHGCAARRLLAQPRRARHVASASETGETGGKGRGRALSWRRCIVCLLGETANVSVEGRPPTLHGLQAPTRCSMHAH